MCAEAAHMSANTPNTCAKTAHISATASILCAKAANARVQSSSETTSEKIYFFFFRYRLFSLAVIGHAPAANEPRKSLRCWGNHFSRSP